jgi:hypothetical protein
VPSPRATRAVQRFATSQMLQSCKIEDVKNPTYDANTLVASPGSRTTVYTGICRIWLQENPSMVRVTETDFLAYSTILSLPYDKGANVKVLNEVEITVSPTDPTWVGARFRIQTLKQGGQIRATRSFVLERLSPKV